MDLKYSTNNNGETYLKLKIGSQTYTLRGYSRAGLKTSILVDELNIGFDMGYSSERSFSFDNKLISHGHTDHIGALHYDHCARKLFKLNRDKLFIMPRQCVKPFRMITTAISEMNCGKPGESIKIFTHLLETNIVESEDCENNYQSLINSEYVVKSFIMDHKIKSYGYIVYRKSNKLKKEFQNLPTNEIINLKHEIGVKNITDICYTPLVGYTGDTTIYGVIQYPEFLNVPLLIMECTGFKLDEISDCINNKHTHWNDIINYHELFQNEKIVLIHFSQQYKIIDDIIQITQESPIELQNKIIYFF